jgi:hypothetical protein
MILLLSLMMLAPASPRESTRLECPLFSVTYARDNATLAFEGPVILVEWMPPHRQIRARVAVERMWKGDRTTHVDVFFSTGTSESHHVDVGRKYLFFSRPMTADDRRGALSAGPERHNWAPDCWGIQAATDDARMELGPSSPPK